MSGSPAATSSNISYSVESRDQRVYMGLAKLRLGIPSGERTAILMAATSDANPEADILRFKGQLLLPCTLVLGYPFLHDS